MYKKSKNISLYHRPLQLSSDITVVGSVPPMQSYQADLNEFTPDYTITPLTLFPRCNAVDPESIRKIGSVNDKLTNMKWYEVVDGVKNLIQNTNKDYEIVESGATKGQITVKKNVQPLHAVTLQFYAEYVDETYTGEKYIFNMSKVIRTVDASEATPLIMIDSPSSSEWNPLRDSPKRVITAKMIVADKDVSETDKCNFFWYRVLPNGNLEQIVDGNGENDWEVDSVTKTKLSIDCDYFGFGATYILKASYNSKGTPSSTPDESLGYVSTNIKRRIPTLDVDWSGVPNEVSSKTIDVYPQAVVRDTKGVIADDIVNDVLLIKWYTKVGAGASNLAAFGIKPKLKFTNGMQIDMSVEDRGVYMQLTSDDGKALTDEQSKPIVVKAQPVV